MASGAQSADEAVSTSLVIINGFLVFFMQVGFLALETGSGRAKNVRNILLKNLLDVMLAAIVWWAVGFAFAYGKSAGGVIGTTQFFYEGEFLEDKYTRPWFFSWTFCIAACTIISGCLAERTALAAYPAATLLIAAIVHPLLVHWIWNPQGFFNSIHECQVLDFAGGMVVHMLGGLFGLVGAYMCGPRLGRFEMLGQDDDDEDWEEQQQQPPPGAALDEDNASMRTNSGRADGGELIDSASELAGSNTPPSDCPRAAQYPDAAGDAAVQSDAAQPLPLPPKQQQQLAASRSLHTLLPSGAVPAVDSASSSRGAVVEMGQLGLGGTKGVASRDITAAAQGAAAGSSNGGVQQPQLATSGGVHPRAQPGRAAAGQAATAASAGNSKWGWVSNLGWQRQPQRPRQQRRWPVRNYGTSAGTCGSGICKFVPKAMPGHDMAFVTLGTFMLWFGWFGFNSGSVYLYVNTSPVASPSSLVGAISAEVVQRTSMNTALGGAAAGLSALLCAALFWGTYDLRICCNGVLSGLVIVTCMCGFVDPWAAVVCSAIAGALYAAGSWLLLRCGIDDPLDSSAVHLGSGILGSIMVAFVANPKHVYALTGSPCGGIFYVRSGWLQLGLQLLALVVVIVFAGGMAWVLFWCLAKRGLLRVDQTTELAGIDNMEHGGPAYPEIAGGCSGGPGTAGPNAVTSGRRLVS